MRGQRPDLPMTCLWPHREGWAKRPMAAAAFMQQEGAGQCPETKDHPDLMLGLSQWLRGGGRPFHHLRCHTALGALFAVWNLEGLKLECQQVSQSDQGYMNF